MKLNELDTLARRQHGVVARTQTTIKKTAWQRAIAAGTLVKIHPSVARLVGTADTTEQRIMAAVLAAGPGALASHRSAAHLHGVPSLQNEAIDLIIPTRNLATPPGDRGKAVVGLKGVQIHRQRDLHMTTRHRIDEIPCTNILRTLVDLGAVEPDAVHGAVGHALTNDLATFDVIVETLDTHARPGRAGIGALRAALDEWSVDAKPVDSVLEPAMRRLIDRYGLPDVEFHPIVGGRQVDFRIAATPIVIECDGWRYYGRDKDQFERDRASDAEFAAHGWIVLRFTYRKITTRAADVADQIRRAIAQWTDRPAPDAA